MRILGQDGDDASARFMANCFAVGRGAVGPTCTLRLLAAEPLFEFFGSHVYEFVELPGVKMSMHQVVGMDARITNSITVSLSLTILRS